MSENYGPSCAACCVLVRLERRLNSGAALNLIRSGSPVTSAPSEESRWLPSDAVAFLMVGRETTRSNTRARRLVRPCPQFLGRALLRLGETSRALEHFNRRTSTTIAGTADIPMAHALSGRTAEAEGNSPAC